MINVYAGNISQTIFSIQAACQTSAKKAHSAPCYSFFDASDYTFQDISQQFSLSSLLVKHQPKMLTVPLAIPLLMPQI
jgi:hypothetical protein